MAEGVVDADFLVLADVGVFFLYTKLIGWITFNYRKNNKQPTPICQIPIRKCEVIVYKLPYYSQENFNRHTAKRSLEKLEETPAGIGRSGFFCVI